jgi:hypothetical protein
MFLPAISGMMDLVWLNARLRELAGERVVARRIAGNSLIIYFGGNPGDKSVISLWLDPAWRYERGGYYAVGSGDFPACDDEEDREREAQEREHAQGCRICDALKGATVARCAAGEMVFDLVVEFEGGGVLRTFASSRTESAWEYRDVRREVCVRVSGSGIQARRLVEG